MPVTVPGLSNVTAVAAGADFSLALLSNGTVEAWGGDEAGQLGDGSTEESDVPVPVKGLSGVVAIAAGARHARALLSTGAVRAWGENEMGQLGDGATSNSYVPVAVRGLTGVKAISAGGEHSLALLEDGTVEGWGSDVNGQIGSNANEGSEEERHSDVPVVIPGVSGASAIAAGAAHSLALVKGGGVLAWGEDRDGQLGNAATAREVQTPVSVSGLDGATAIAAGGNHSIALVATVSSVTPPRGGTPGGAEVTISGTSFTGATAVSFGGTPATGVEVKSPTSLVAVAPAHAVGTADVTVTTEFGASPVNDKVSFKYKKK